MAAPAGLAWADGFEYGLASSRRSDTVLAGEMYTNMNASGAGTAIATATTPVKSGTYSLQLSSGTPLANYCYLERGQISGAGRFGTQSVWWRASANPSNDVLVFGLGHEGTTFSELAVGSGGQMKLRARTADSFTNMTGVTVTAGNWYRLEMWADYGASGTVTFQVKARVYDATGTIVGSEATVNASGTNTATTVDSFTIDCDVATGALAASVDFFFDDWVYSTTSADYPLSQFGDWTVDLVTLSANGTHNLTAGDLDKTDDSGSNWEALANPETTVQAADSYTLLDEIPWSTSDTDWVRQDVVRTTTYAEYQLTDQSSIDPWGVMVGVHVKNASTNASTIAARIATSGTESTTGNLSTTHAATSRVHKATFFRNDGAGNAWTLTNLNATTVRVGYASDVTTNPHYCAIAVQVARVAVAGGTTDNPPLGTSTGTGIAPTATVSAPIPPGTVPGTGINAGAVAATTIGTAVATGIAPASTVSTPIPLGTAPGSGITFAPSTTVPIPPGLAVATGVSPTDSSQLVETPTRGDAVATGISPGAVATAGVGTAPGSGITPAVTVSCPIPPGLAIASGIAPSDSTQLTQTPTPGVAVGTGITFAISASAPISPGQATGTGTAFTASASVPIPRGTVPGTGVSPALLSVASLPSGAATGTGTNPAFLLVAHIGPGLAVCAGISPTIPGELQPVVVALSDAKVTGLALTARSRTGRLVADTARTSIALEDVVV